MKRQSVQCVELLYSHNSLCVCSISVCDLLASNYGHPMKILESGVEAGEGKEMKKNTLLGLILFIVSEILSVIALFTSDWVVSSRVGESY